MGFTRTSEGRVFFKGADNDDAPRFEAAPLPAPSSTASPNATTSAPAQSTESKLSVDQTQMQILLLLKSLNTKLKTSKEEQAAMKQQLAAYKETLKKIKESTSGYESNYIDLEQKVARKQTEAQKQVMRVEETLKDTLKQLDEARSLVSELEAKADDGTETIESLKNQFKTELEARKAEEEKLIKRQKEIEKAQSSQSEKMVDHVAAYVALTKRVSESEARQATLHNKIEENTSEFLKLDRKIDKTVEDRNRILRKIERIESAVMETRDALNAKAMVLLTQQGASPSAIEYPQIPQSSAEKIEDTSNQWWKKQINLNPITLAILLIFVLLAGLAISAIFSITSTDSKNAYQYEQSTSIIREALPPPVSTQKTAASSTEPLPLKMEINPRFVETVEKSAKQPTHDLSQDTAIATIEPETADVSAAPSIKDEDSNYGITIHKGQNKESPVSNSVNLSNEKQTLAMMEKNPEQVAAELNKIEPVSFPKTEKQTEANATEKNLHSTSDSQKNSSPINKKTYKEQILRQIKPDPSLNEVIRKIEAQAFDGVPEAQHDMGAIYIAGSGPVKQNLKRAVFWFEESARNGVANAQYNLGVLYHQGLGVEKNLNTAINLYQKAADQGHPEAQYNLGIANIEGIGVPYNPQKAAKYFENAANKNVMEAAYNLGLIYENGLLGETHPDEALMWYKRAADNGSPEATAALKQLANSLGIALSDVNRVVEKTLATKKNNSTEQESQQYVTSQIQKELMDRGLYPGPVDGMNGPMTANAIKNFQSASSIAADGIPSKDLLNYMRSSGN